MLSLEFRGMYILYERMNKTKRLKKSWGLSDLKMLVWIIGKYCEKNKIRDVEKGIVSFVLTQKEEDWK